MSQSPPKTILCCGKLYKSGKYHQRTVHQQYTKIRFKNHPDANFRVERNPSTAMFHCPQCDKSWAMATSLRNHIIAKCNGYEQYRGAVPKIKIKPLAIAGAQQNPNGGGANAAKSASVNHKVENKDLEAAVVSEAEADVQEGGKEKDSSKENSTSSVLVYPSDSDSEPTSSISPTTPVAFNPDSINNQGDDFAFPLPTLRPALWSPVNLKPDVCSSVLRGSGASPATSTSVLPSSSTFSSRLSSLSDTHNFCNLSSSSSSAPTGFAIKTEYDNLDQPLRMLGTSLLTATSRNGPFSAIKSFLDTLRRPLGFAAPLFHTLGLVTEEDLDLVCTMPEAWDELGEHLRGGGVTVIEWLMVKEAFKARRLAGQSNQ